MTRILQSNLARSAAGLLAGLLVLSPVAGQEGDMASRMILELQQMREEVRELRGLVEAQAQEIENLKRRQRDQYLDLDSRLSGLRGSGASAPVTATTGSPGSSTSVPGEPIRAGAVNATAAPSVDEPGEAAPPIAPTQDLPEVREPLDEQPEVTSLQDPGDAGVRQLEAPTQAEQEAYDQAFRALRETRYADAAEGFDRFLRDHPRSEYAPNALYWLGEVYYVTRDFETALAQFQRLQEVYPTSGKQPDALLKIGFSHYELGQWERARAALEQVIADYPGTNYSRLAENRLRTMRLEGNL